MTETAAIGDGPIVFFTENGQQVSLPLSAISFDGNAVKSRPTSPTLKAWLEYLVAQGRLTPGTAPAPGNAMVFTAAAAGSTGNNIVVTVAQNTNPAKVDVTVTETDTYVGLTLDPASPNFLPTVLGLINGPAGTRPGLVRVRPLGNNAPDPDNGDGNLVTPTVGNPAWTIAAPVITVPPGPTSFTLEARGAGSVADEWTTVKVSNVQPPATTGRKTFTLTVTWTKKVQGVGTVTELNALPDALKFAVTITKPSNADFKLPRLGAVSLGGGADPAQATQAKATLLAST